MSDKLISQSDLRKLQLAELEIFKAIQEVCDKNHICYYLSSGTLLGAVRHGGFIPWDDDMDICMPRPDYNRFRNIVDKELSSDYFCIDYKKRDTNDLSVGTMLKVASKKVKVQRRRGDGHTITIDNAWVDIFPLDGLPNEKKKREKYGKKLKYTKRLLSFAKWKDEGVAKQKTTKRKVLAKIITVTHLAQILNLDRKKQRDRLDNMLQTYDYRGSDYCINMLGDYELREICPTAMYGTPKDIVFEGITVKGPQDPDGILKIIYGDYMQLPPKESQVCKHCMSIIVEE